MTPDLKLQICKQTRKIASDSLAKTLKELLGKNEPISEKLFADKWLENLRKHSEIFPEGWYIPPPHGIGVLFSEESDPGRVSYKSLRSKDKWPSGDVILDPENGLAYFYASPVNKEFGIIGDFGVSLCFGNNEKIKDHLRLCYEITKKVFDFIEIGMRFSDIAKYSNNLCAENNLINTIVSSTDPTGTNIGHTIPAISEDWTAEERKVFDNGEWEEVCKLISGKRIFVNEIEQTKVKPGMAITIEPRPINPADKSLPMVGFHTIALFYEGGKKELLNEFREISRLVEMDYLL